MAGVVPYSFLKSLYEMRRVGERAFDTDLGDGFRRRDKQQTRLHESLTDKPSVRRHVEVAFELLLERGERTVAQCRQFFDRYVAEDVRVDDLFEIVARGVHVREDLALKTAVRLRYDKIHQFGQLDILGRLVVHEVIVLQVADRMSKEACGASSTLRSKRDSIVDIGRMSGCWRC